MIAVEPAANRIDKPSRNAMIEKDKKIVIEYLKGRINEIVEEGKEAIAVHGMPSYPYMKIANQISVLENEIDKLQNKKRHGKL